MEVKDRSLIVLTPDGKFERIARRGRECGIGEEIGYIGRSSRFRFTSLPILSSTAASVVLLLILMIGLTGLFGTRSVEAYVSIDMNPSVELGIDAKERVRELRGLNDDGNTLIQGISFSGRPLFEVTEALLQKAEAGKVQPGESDIVVAITLVNSDTNLDDWMISSNVKDAITRHVQGTHPEAPDLYRVTAFAAPVEVRQAAQAEGVSAGKYSVYLSAKSSGLPVDLKQVREQSIHSLLGGAGGIGKLLTPDKQTKETIKNLLKAEKDGKLGAPAGSGQNDQKNSGGTSSKNNNPGSSYVPNQSSNSSASKSAVVPRTPQPTLSSIKKNILQPAYKQQDHDKDNANGKKDRDDDKDKDKDKNKEKEKEKASEKEKPGNSQNGKPGDDNRGDRVSDSNRSSERDEDEEKDGKSAANRFGFSSLIVQPEWTDSAKKSEAQRKADEDSHTKTNMTTPAQTDKKSSSKDTSSRSDNPKNTQGNSQDKKKEAGTKQPSGDRQGQDSRGSNSSR